MTGYRVAEGAMKILHDDPDLLVLRRRPWFLATALSALILVMVMGVFQTYNDGRPGESVLFVAGIGIVLVLVHLFVQADTVTFDRRASEMRHDRRTLLGNRTETIPLDRIRGARVQTTGNSGTKQSPAHRPVLDLSPEGSPPYRLVARYVKGGGARRAANAINDWLPAPDR
jgi:hypothetical protein